MTDVTERIQASKKLKESEEKFRFLADNSIDCLWQADTTLRFTYLSPALYSMTGFKPEEWVGTKISQHTTMKEFFKMGRLALKMLRSYEEFSWVTFETKMFNKKGELIPLEIVSKPLIKDGKLKGLQGSTRLIAERKEAEQKLKDSEEKFRNVFDKSVDGIMITDTEARIASWNDGMEQITGLSKKEVAGKYIWDVQASMSLRKEADAEHKKYIKDSIIEFIKTGNNPFGSDISEQELQRKDGKIRTIQSVMSVVETTKGNILASISRDITFKKTAEEQLRRGREKLREALEATTEGIWEWDVKKNTLNFSPRYYTMLGYEPNEFKPDMDSWSEMVHPEDKESVMKKEREFIESGMETYSDEFRMVTKTGGYRWIRSKGKVVEWDDDEKPIRVIGSHEDITYEKLAEMEIQKIQQSYINIVESSINGILILDTEGMISYVNPEAQKILDQTENELVGKPFGIPFEDAEASEVEVTQKSGEIRYVDIRTTTVKWDGAESTLVLLHDITSKKIAEAELRETNKKLEELSRELEKKVEEQVKQLREKDHLLIKQSRHAAMGEMISNIAHQWRQPLTAVGAIVQDIEEAYKYGELSEEYLHEAIGNSMEQLEYMSNTINDFRNFFIPNRETEEFSINRSIRKTIHFVESSFKNNSIRLEADLKEECLVEGFANEYTQILLNILNNAKDAIKNNKPENPYVLITLRKIDSDTHSSRVTIENNGGNIPEDILDKIFDPYFTTKHQSEGTGLGLYMSKMLIDNMKGTITVENIKDGVKFIIEV